MQIPESVVLPFAKSKMIKVCNRKMTVVAISRSDSNFSMKKRWKCKTIVPRWFYDFNPRDLGFDPKCFICSLSLTHTHSFAYSHSSRILMHSCLLYFLFCLWRLRFSNNIVFYVFVTLKVCFMFLISAYVILPIKCFK